MRLRELGRDEMIKELRRYRVFRLIKPEITLQVSESVMSRFFDRHRTVIIADAMLRIYVWLRLLELSGGHQPGRGGS